MDCRIILVLICVCFNQQQVCYGHNDDCKTYERSKIKEYCKEFHVENAVVCYKRINKKKLRWEARIDCLDRFKLHCRYDKDPKCSARGNSTNYKWSESEDDYKCQPKKNLVKEVVVKILVVLMLGLLLLIIKELCKRSNCRCLLNRTQCFKTDTESEQSQPDQSSEKADSKVVYKISKTHESVYHCIEDIDVVDDITPAFDDENSEYNTLHEHLNSRPFVRYDLTSQGNTYSHVTFSRSGTNAGMNTYSHINDEEAHNISLSADDDKIIINCEVNMVKDEESVYNHTNTRIMVPACADSAYDTDAHIDNALEITDADHDID